MIVTSKNTDRTLTPEIVENVLQQKIFWSDDRLCHWFFDFKCQGKWISCWYINNELTQIVVDVFE
jgi:hypothetical protein